MGEEHPGSSKNTEALKSALTQADNVTENTSVPMGGKLEKRVIDPRIKPGTRAHRMAMLNLGAAEDDEPLDPDGTEPADPESETSDQQPVIDPAVHGAAPVEDSEGNKPWDKLSTHAELDAYVEQNNIHQPDGWDRMTVADKKSFLDGNSGAEEPKAV